MNCAAAETPQLLGRRRLRHGVALGIRDLLALIWMPGAAEPRITRFSGATAVCSVMTGDDSADSAADDRCQRWFRRLVVDFSETTQGVADTGVGLATLCALAYLSGGGADG